MRVQRIVSWVVAAIVLPATVFAQKTTYDREIDTNAKPEKRDENISKAVEKIFRNYPPKVKK